MTTRCKVQCQSVTKSAWPSSEDKNRMVYSAKFTAVYGDSPENKIFFAATPSIGMDIATIREDHFQIGKTYYVDFTEAP